MPKAEKAKKFCGHEIGYNCCCAESEPDESVPDVVDFMDRKNKAPRRRRESEREY